MESITPTQLIPLQCEENALRSYAEWAGDDWKRQLHRDWLRGGSRWPGEWAPLQRLRNQLGPKWLASYELPQQADKKITVRLGCGIVEVLSLDDSGMRAELGIECRTVNKREIEATGTWNGLWKLMEHCGARGFSGSWDQPPWYARSAQAAHHRLSKVLIKTVNK